MAFNVGILTITLGFSSLASGLLKINSLANQHGSVDASAARTSFTASRNGFTGWTAEDYGDKESLKTSAFPEAIGTLPSYPEVTDRPGASTMSIATSNDVEVEFGQGDRRSGHYYEDMDTLSRNKRTLTFPDPSTILLIFGLGTPLQLDRESIILGVFTKIIYNLPLNSTDFTEPGVHFARTKTRWSIYKVLERAAQLYGYGGGKGCLLRAICEVAAAPFDLHHGLFGQMVQAFLTIHPQPLNVHEYVQKRSLHPANPKRISFHLTSSWNNDVAMQAGCKFTIGVTVPVAMDKTGGIAFSAGFQFNYVLPWNLSQFDPVIVPSREIGNFNLQDIYTALEGLLDKHDWQRSRVCLLRTICELAETPLNRHEHTDLNKRDVLPEIIHLILTPSEDLPEAVNSSHRSINELYQEAERLGRSGGDCILTYPDCIESPLESFTEIAFP